MEKKIFKKRYFTNPKKFKLSFGDSGLVFLKEGRLEFIQISFFKKILKKLTYRNAFSSMGRYERKKIWYSLISNFVIQCKSKNSRMGKGKGLVERKIIRVRSGLVLFEFTGFSFFKLIRFTNKINKKLNSKVKLVLKKNLNFRTIYKNNQYKLYYNKYLF